MSVQWDADCKEQWIVCGFNRTIASLGPKYTGGLVYIGPFFDSYKAHEHLKRLFQFHPDGGWRVVPLMSPPDGAA